MDAQANLSAEAHSSGTREFISVCQGELRIVVNQEEYQLVEGDSISFRADRPHAYCNPGKTTTRAHMVIHYTD